MKKSNLLAMLATLLLLTGCSTTTAPSTPEPHPDKYALQIIQIEAPAGSIKIPEPTLGFSPNTNLPQKPPQITDLLNNPDARVYEFPIVYAAVGETAINDQAETHSFPTMYEPQTDSNGVVSVVYTHHKDIKIGQYVEMTLQKVENAQATCDLWFYEKKLNGMQKYNVALATETQDAVTASLPIFKALEMKTKITIAQGSWVSLGGLSAAKNPTLITDKHLFIRILPPQK